MAAGSRISVRRPLCQGSGDAGGQVLELHPDRLVLGGLAGARIEQGIGRGGTDGTEDAGSVLGEVEKPLGKADNLGEAAAAGPQEEQIFFACSRLWGSGVIMPRPV